jgi:hypothetical protein
VAVKLGEMDVTLLPPLTRAVPVEEVYQSIVQLAAGVALKTTVPLPQRELLLAAVGAAGMAFAAIEVVAPPVVVALHAPVPFNRTQ